jgi:hypothetical protein
MLKGFLLAVALALLAAGCMGDDGGDGGGGVAASEGESLVLQQEDVGSEFTQFDSGEQRRADFSPPRDDPNRLGREGGWKARFSRTGTPETQGALVISSLADLSDRPTTPARTSSSTTPRSTSSSRPAGAK